MAQEAELNVTPREVMGKANKKLRRTGLIPGNISGHKEAPLAVQMNAVELDRLRRSHGLTSIIRLNLPNMTETALIRHIQHGPRSGKIIHVDFDRVSLSERVTVHVALHFVGDAPGVKIAGGVLISLLDGIEVECMASDIVDYIDVDVTGLTEIDSMLHAGDVKLPANFTLVTDPAEPIAKVNPTRAEAATEAAPVPPETPRAEPAPGE